MTKKMSKPKTVVKKKIESISMSINGAEFYAEGDADEVNAKLRAWLDEALSPIRKVREIAEKTFKP